MDILSPGVNQIVLVVGVMLIVLALIIISVIRYNRKIKNSGKTEEKKQDANVVTEEKVEPMLLLAKFNEKVSEITQLKAMIIDLEEKLKESQDARTHIRKQSSEANIILNEELSNQAITTRNALDEITRVSNENKHFRDAIVSLTEDAGKASDKLEALELEKQTHLTRILELEKPETEKVKTNKPVKK